MVSLLYRHLYDHEPEKLTSSGWDLKDVIGFAKFKYPKIDTGIYLRSIVYFNDAEKETAQKEVEMAWEQIKEFLEFQCKSLLKDINLL